VEERPGRPRRICALYESGEDEPVSRLSLTSLTIRFGAAAVEAEGVGGVNTLPTRRGRGYNRLLMERALAGASERVDVAFLYGIEGLYGKYGFVTCLRESRIAVWTGRTDGLAGSAEVEVAPGSAEDLAEAIALYNELHRLRPWTSVRAPDTTARLSHASAWRPAPEVVIARRSGTMVAYAVAEGASYGQRPRTCTILEAGARDESAATALLAALGSRCRERDVCEFTINEPGDGVVGRTAAAIGCSESTETAPDGGGMASILNRRRLVTALEPELVRRADASYSRLGIAPAAGVDAVRRGVVRRLAAGELVADDGDLVRLLLGYRSWEEVGHRIDASPDDRPVLRGFFPGDGTTDLPTGYAHQFDRY